MRRIYERDTDQLFLRQFRENPPFAKAFLEQVVGKDTSRLNHIVSQVRHRRDTGTIDFEVHCEDVALLIENKIDAGYSITRDGSGQPDRYRRSVAALREGGREALSVLLAPEVYLASSKLAAHFDKRVSYESLRALFEGNDLSLIDRAIEQASAPYEPVANSGTMSFFASYEKLVAERFSDLKIKQGPNADGVRPGGSRTIYFDVRRTLTDHAGVPRPRMSLQCLDSGAATASVKIMLGGLGTLCQALGVPQSLRDVGGYLRPAGRSLGIVIDTPRLNTQRAFDDQIPEVVEGLEAALRLQAWWGDSRTLLQEWLHIGSGTGK